MKIILVRHGQSTGNKLRIVQGQKDCPLTELGEEQAEELAQQMLKDNFSCDSVYSSDLARAKRTTEILVEILKLEVTKYDERLREMNTGYRQGKKHDDLTTEEVQHQKNVFADHDLKFPGGECVNEMKSRINESFEEIVQDHKENETILIVGHGGTLYHILFHILGIYPEPSEWFSNCSYNEIYRNKSSDKWKLKIYNNTNM